MEDRLSNLEVGERGHGDVSSWWHRSYKVSSEASGDLCYIFLEVHAVIDGSSPATAFIEMEIAVGLKVPRRKLFSLLGLCSCPT